MSEELKPGTPVVYHRVRKRQTTRDITGVLSCVWEKGDMAAVESEGITYDDSLKFIRPATRAEAEAAGLWTGFEDGYGAAQQPATPTHDHGGQGEGQDM